MSYSPELSPIHYSEEEKIAPPTIKLKLKLNPVAPSEDKKKKKHKKKHHKKKHKKRTADESDGDDYNEDASTPHMHVGGKRPFAMLQQQQHLQHVQEEEDNIDEEEEEDLPYQQEEGSEAESYHPTDMKRPKLKHHRNNSNSMYAYDAAPIQPEPATATATTSAKPPTKKGRRSSSMKSNVSAGNNGEKPKKRGRPTNKAKAAAAIAALPPKVPEVPKKDTKSILLKLLDTIQKKDAYGFFLEPVNPKLVPDYLKIIKSPMDFSTMRSKIEAGQYESGQDFRHDFNLIISNAKLYNSVETIYWKSADKVYEYGTKLIDRAEKQIEEEKAAQAAAAAAQAVSASPALEDSYSSRKMSISFTGRKDSFGIKEEDVDIMGIDNTVPLRKQSRQGSEIHTREASVDLASSRAITPIRSLNASYKKKKKKVADTGVLYGPDGSLHTVGGVSDLETLLPREHSFADPPQLIISNPAALPSAFFMNRHSADDFFHNKHLVHAAHFCDYGPFTTLGGQPPGAFYTALDASYIYPLYGDDRGEAYMKSLWDYLDDDDEQELVQKIDDKANYLTRGAWKVVQQTLERKNDNLEKKEIPLESYHTVDTEFGPVQAAAIVDKIESKLHPLVVNPSPSAAAPTPNTATVPTPTIA